MKSLFIKRFGIYFASVALVAAFLFGCGTEEGDQSVNPIDSVGVTFPVSGSIHLFPLETLPAYHFRQLSRLPSKEWGIGEDISITITKRLSGYFGYSQFDGSRGVLLMRQETGNPDSLGIYIVGSFNDTSEYLFTPRLWIPNSPEAFLNSWTSGPYKIFYDKSDTVLWLNPNFSDNSFERDNVFGRVRMKVETFLEKSGDTINVYRFSRLYGLVGMERTVNGTLQAISSLKFYTKLGRL